MKPYVVAAVDDIPPGTRQIVTVKGRQIGIFNLDGSYYALQNLCPHQGAPVCLGHVDGTNLPSRPNEYCWSRQSVILGCPWHSWEFELASGQALFEPQIRLKTFKIEAIGSNIVIYL